MKSFIIHLSKIPTSLETATRLKTQLEEYNMEAELFEGTYGNDAVKLMEQEDRVVHAWGIKGPHPKAGTGSTAAPKLGAPGVKGCFYSHYNLWKKCVELNEPIIIWEDDILISRPYIPVEWKDILVLAIGHPKKSAIYMPLLESPEGDPDSIDYRYASMPGCCGYAIKPHAAKKLLEIYSRTYLPADNAINKFHVNIQIHNHLMGIAMIKTDGKNSLTRTKYWNEKLYSTYVISNKPDKFSNIKESISPEPILYFDGAGYTSFSALVNDCVAQAPYETVIIMSDKVLPTVENVKKLLLLLEQGYAFVGLYRLGFFGFKKELLRKIGMFDERFVGGGYEDDDFYIRLKEADLAVYITHEVAYTKSASSWDYSQSAIHFNNKWGDIRTTQIIQRNMAEDNYNYNLGKSIPVNFLSWDRSAIGPKKVHKYAGYPIIQEVKIHE